MVSEYTSSRTNNVPSANVQPYNELGLTSSRSIRLLKLKPASPQNSLTIEAELYVTHLDNVKDQFDALSYTWDETGRNCHIIINGERWTIFQNLYDFLKSLRDAGIVGPLWADAICISQKNNDEKNHQVRLMSEIYTSARLTRSWLGNDFQDLSSFMKSMHDGCAFPHSLTWCNDERELLQRLVRHRYWTRTWVVQEIILAKVIMVHCSHEWLSWPDFIRLSKRICAAAGRRAKDQRLHISTLVESPLMRHDTRRSQSQGRTLPQLLKDHGDTQCRDVRDRVFAMLGLITDTSDPLCCLNSQQEGSRLHEVVDYSLSLATLFARLVRLYGDAAQKQLAQLLWVAFELNKYALSKTEIKLTVEFEVTLESSWSTWDELANRSCEWKDAKSVTGQFMKVDFDESKNYNWRSHHPMRLLLVKLPLDTSALGRGGLEQKPIAVRAVWPSMDDHAAFHTLAQRTCDAMRSTIIVQCYRDMNPSQTFISMTLDAYALVLKFTVLYVTKTAKPLTTSGRRLKNQIPTTIADLNSRNHFGMPTPESVSLRLTSRRSEFEAYSRFQVAMQRWEIVASLRGLAIATLSIEGRLRREGDRTIKAGPEVAKFRLPWQRSLINPVRDNIPCDQHGENQTSEAVDVVTLRHWAIKQIESLKVVHTSVTTDSPSRASSSFAATDRETHKPVDAVTDQTAHFLSPILDLMVSDLFAWMQINLEKLGSSANFDRETYSLADMYTGCLQRHNGGPNLTYHLNCELCKFTLPKVYKAVPPFEASSQSSWLAHLAKLRKYSSDKSLWTRYA